MNPACERVRELHLELHPWRMTPEIDAHLERCPDCADHCARQEHVARCLRSMSRRAAPASLWASLQSRLTLDRAPVGEPTLDRPEAAPAPALVGELFAQLAYRSAPPDLWERVQDEIQRRESVVWSHRPGSGRIRRWSRLARAAVILLPLLVGSYLLWNEASPRGRQLEIVWTKERVERHADPGDPIEQVAFQLGDGSWAAGKR